MIGLIFIPPNLSPESGPLASRAVGGSPRAPFRTGGLPMNLNWISGQVGAGTVGGLAEAQTEAAIPNHEDANRAGY